jgi:hypothetical protein
LNQQPNEPSDNVYLIGQTQRHPITTPPTPMKFFERLLSSLVVSSAMSATAQQVETTIEDETKPLTSPDWTPTNSSSNRYPGAACNQTSLT